MLIVPCLETGIVNHCTCAVIADVEYQKSKSTHAHACVFKDDTITGFVRYFVCRREVRKNIDPVLWKRPKNLPPPEPWSRPTLLPRAFRTHASKFHCSSRLAVNVGDRIPDVELMENSPGNKVNVAKELKGKGLIIGVPAAFSPACSATHIPGYINFQGLKNAGQVFVVSVNDAFIRFLADPHAAFTQALDLDFDGTAIFGGPRSKRYALTIDDGVVKKVHVEPDNTGLKESVVEKVLGSS
ncbi:MAG: hypothetical protein Q9157_005730 [Trypethelium eluteriae]